MTRLMGRHQQGVALISVLLIVVIATVLGVTIAREQNFTITRARLFVEDARVRQYALGGEELARQILFQDFVEAADRDSLDEGWAGLDLAFEFEQGSVALQIEDLQGRFNLNALVADDAGIARDRFARLLAQLGLEEAFVDRIIDWVDANQDVRPLGAEDYDYLGLDQPYRTSGQAMVDVSELGLLLNMDPVALASLAAVVAALPVENTTINVNTALPAVLQAIAPEVDSASLVMDPEVEGYASVDDFLAREILAGQGIPRQGLGVQSSFFQVSIRADYQGRTGYLTSILQRSALDGGLRVIHRDMSRRFIPVAMMDALNVGQGGADAD